MRYTRWFAISLLAAPLALSGCGGDGTGTQARSQVSVRMGVARGGAGALRSADGLASVGGPLAVAGSNGTLSITGIQVVVAKFQLRGADNVACDGSRADDECEFQAGPFFVDVPLDGSQLNVTTGAVPPGTYGSLRFRVKNLDIDDDDDGTDDDDATPAQVTALFGQIRAQIPDWPQKASMLVSGTFTPTGGAPRAFRAFLRAEVKLTLPINPPLTVAEGSTSSAVAVVMDPASFFKSGATVVDLSQFNGRLGEFKVEAEHGFHSEGHHGNDD